MIQPSDIHTLTEFKRNSAELLEQLETSRRPQVLTVDGHPKAVVLDVETFERLSSLVDQAEAIEGIRRGLDDVKAGRTMSLQDFEKSLRERLGMKSGK